MSGPDRETRERVLTVATRMFAANGFRKVTIREICRKADANVAAVNYYFGDKNGLYREVLGRAIEIMRGTTEAARKEGEGRSAEQKLKAYVRVFLERVVGQGHDSWIHQIMTREMAEPSPALDLVVNQVLRPRMAYLSEVVADILQVPVEDSRVMKCVVSVQSQFHALMLNPLARRITPDLSSSPAAIDVWTEHIVRFSLGGIRSLAQ